MAVQSASAPLSPTTRLPRQRFRTGTFEVPTPVLTYSAEPSFENDKTSILKAGNGTSILLVDNGTEFAVGTAFFIAPSILVTAGHSVTNAWKPGAQLIISLPGQPVVDILELRQGT